MIIMKRKKTTNLKPVQRSERLLLHHLQLVATEVEVLETCAKFEERFLVHLLYHVLRELQHLVDVPRWWSLNGEPLGIFRLKNIRCGVSLPIYLSWFIAHISPVVCNNLFWDSSVSLWLDRQYRTCLSKSGVIGI